jgi:hypothetical protein
MAFSKSPLSIPVFRTFQKTVPTEPVEPQLLLSYFLPTLFNKKNIEILKIEYRIYLMEKWLPPAFGLPP